MPNVTFKFIITETPLPADQDGRQQIIASISDDNAKRITDLTGLAGEVEALKAHCHRMLNLARNRYLGYCDHNRAVQELPKPAADSADVLTMLAETTLDNDRLSRRVAELKRANEAAHAKHNSLAARVAELEGEPYTYKSNQATNCAVCGKHKHTPLRRDHMGGYVCLTCIDAEMDKALAALAEMQNAAAKLAEAEKCRADQVIALNAYAEQRDSARQDADTLRCEVMEERNRREKSDSIANEAAKQRDRVKELAAEALIALKREWPQHALWRAKSPEAEPIRRLATAVGVELAETEIQRHGDVAAKLAQSSVLMPVLAEISRALTKFPTWPTDPLHAMAVLGEEYGELNKAILQEVYEPHKQDRAAVRTEAVQCAAMALRFLTSIDAYRFDRCEQHRQDVKDA